MGEYPWTSFFALRQLHTVIVIKCITFSGSACCWFERIKRIFGLCKIYRTLKHQKNLVLIKFVLLYFFIYFLEK